ncbi:MAG: triose-phosphate isomerase [Bacteroidetes bacterium]|nr:triose-phosphate isomerase [Bacteroidota bacterium]
MRPYIVAGNWKMNLDARSGQSLASEIRATLEQTHPGGLVRVLLCPPFPLLPSVAEALTGSDIGLGGQNLYPADNGAFTGEVSAPMLAAAGCSHVILGHSERRGYFGETDAFINKKVRHALAHKLLPIICMGETLEQREQDKARQTVETQFRGVLKDIDGDSVGNLILAYEPVWAIGTGKTATPKQAQEMHGFIRTLLSSTYGDSVAQSVVLQYGGSVNADNAADLFAQEDVDGGLIGGASLRTQDFLSIVTAAAEAAKRT